MQFKKDLHENTAQFNVNEKVMLEYLKNMLITDLILKTLLTSFECERI